MVETGGLENRCTGNRTGGSNPSPSAISYPELSGTIQSCPTVRRKRLKTEVDLSAPVHASPRLSRLDRGITGGMVSSRPEKNGGIAFGAV